MFRVATATARNILAVARDPWVLTLWTYGQLLVHERYQRIEREFGVHEQAHLMKLSFHDPKTLGIMTDRLKTRYLPHVSKKELMQRAARTLATARAQRRRLT